ncbi:hypothetical protein [Pectobacterium phage Wc4-1]|uniref:Macro domain-containing protein n=1 Tax=Pectobacterium phage Wc4 TaxID=2652428 RepID=A0A5P8D645_9CAUD|nr:hypothetical protein [Pectobacterium phage Wc4]QFP93934.1 hypothetical protein [Pectobacterium phage Wc4-1]
MAIIKIIKGDLLKMFKQGHFDVIAHGANCQNIMGGGIAAQISSQFPEALKADQVFYERMGKTDNIQGHTPNPAMAGHMSEARVKGGGQIVNLYTQITLGRNAKYQYVERACAKLNRWCKGNSITRLGLPMIGSGIGGLDPVAVACIINATMPDVDVTLVIWPTDNVIWGALMDNFSNYAAPRKVDGLVLRQGVDMFKFWDTANPEGVEQEVDINLCQVTWRNGYPLIQLSISDPNIYLLVSCESEVPDSMKLVRKKSAESCQVTPPEKA